MRSLQQTFRKMASRSFYAIALLSVLSGGAAFAQTYCTPTYTSGCSLGDDISAFKLTGDIAPGINNTTPTCPTGAYTYFSSQSATLTAGQTYSGNANTSYSGNYENIRIWIDYNNDGIFQPSEQIAALADQGSSSTGAFTFTVPVAQAPGTYRLRVRLVYSTSPSTIDPCASYTWGETQDYNVVVIASTPCTGTPNAGTLDTMSVCKNTAFSISTSGATLAGGLEMQWQQRTPSGTGTWTNIAGATSYVYTNTTGIAAATDYRFIIKCVASGQSDTSNAQTVTLKPILSCYCVPVTTSPSYYINTFTTTGGIQNINNTNSGYSTGGYGNFTGSDTVSQVPGQSVSFSGSFGSSSSYTFGVKIWVDWNQDGNFNGPGEQVYATSGYTSAISGTITVPANAAIGSTRMRVGANYLNSTGPANPCENFGSGEYEDYTFTVVPLVNCASGTFPSTAVATSSKDTVCVSEDINLNMTTQMPPVSGLTYQWQTATSPSGPWTNEGPTLSSPPYTATNVNTQRYYRLQVLCGTTVKVTTNVLPILISNPSLQSVTDGQHCGPGTVVLQGVPSANTTLKWYAEETGGLPLGSGTSFTTPFLNETDTFYVSAGVGSGTLPPTFIGTSTASTSSNPSPFYNLYDGNRNQYLIRADELTAAGFSAGTITAIGFDVLSVGNPSQNFVVKMGQTSQTTLSTAWITGLTEVYSTAVYTPVPNAVNDITLTTPFIWDGVSNLVIETCFYNGSWGSPYTTVKYTTGLSFNASHYWQADGNASICSTTSPGSGTVLTSRPNIQFTINSGCESPRQMVIAHIRPFPQVDLGNDKDECVSVGTSYTLDAGTYPNNPTYLWQDGTTGQTRQVSTSGIYSVIVTNSFGCSGTDSVLVNLRYNPQVNLGNDTTVCVGESVLLDAGPEGISYFWSTGETTRKIEVDQTGTYSVFVTNAAGCTGQDSIKVTTGGVAAAISGIKVTNIAPRTFKFKAINPINDMSYDWDFGDGTVHSASPNPSHTYASVGNYLVKLKVLGSCGVVHDSVYVTIVGVEDIAKNDGGVLIYPNPSRDQVNITAEDGIQIEQIDLFNSIGQKVYSQLGHGAQSVSVRLSAFASGLYTVQIQTNEGMVVRKLEILK